MMIPQRSPAKELEREAKEKEFVDGQHANMIDGVWHCSNCGCPESIAIGRRKGPLGDKSQCGTCGKFWHRHRRPRPVQYHADAEYHLNLKREEEQAKLAASRKKRAHHDAPSSKAATVEPDTPSKPKLEIEAPKLEAQASEQPSEATRATSPASVASSASEPPLAQTVKMNGAAHSAQSTPATTSNENKNSAVPAPPESSTSPQTGNTTPAVSASPIASVNRTIPDWLKEAMKEMQNKYPDDKFEVILRKTASSQTAEWRVKCLDCPGKLYTPGPGETLTNYEVHLKNRQHRQKVNNRLNGVQS
ncbi:hypothetical protein NM688_g4928 [Phlebia brevispora]|uniref:Uncharacterized protein n=1 Tax=Phlebia brevispora TaxID=194682 RepID=A0ACC1T1P3_9APHY|nr:hypothetical protein NM688_g4928 [Phlebia brevispora]